MMSVTYNQCHECRDKTNAMPTLQASWAQEFNNSYMGGCILLGATATKTFFEWNHGGGSQYYAGHYNLCVPKPTPAEADATGDPHVSNIRGESFDVKRAGWYTFVQIPRALSPAQAPQFRVDANVEPRHDICGELYIREVHLTGKMMQQFIVGLNFTLRTQLLEPSLLVNGIPLVDAQLPSPLVSVTKHTAEVHTGGIVSYLSMARAGCCYPYLNYRASFSKTAFKDHSEIGGLLGQDGHSEVATWPEHCQKKVKLAEGAQHRTPTFQSYAEVLRAKVGVLLH